MQRKLYMFHVHKLISLDISHTHDAINTIKVINIFIASKSCLCPLDIFDFFILRSFNKRPILKILIMQCFIVNYRYYHVEHIFRMYSLITETLHMQQLPLTLHPSLGTILLSASINLAILETSYKRKHALLEEFVLL
jgi:hypothetical protein